MRALVNVACTLRHAVPGMADIHIPPDALIRAASVHVQGFAGAPSIRSVAADIADVAGFAACLRGTCRRQPKAADHQHGGCHSPGQSLHDVGFTDPAGRAPV
jgi:hypothetical protein